MAKKSTNMMKNKYLYLSLLLAFILLVWVFTRKEGLETKEDGSGCLITDTNADGEDSSFNVSVPCEQFKEVLMGSSLDEFSSL